MIIRTHIKAFMLALLVLFCAAGGIHAAQRVENYGDALQKTGSDGILIYCYGADWNRNSVHMLSSFWNSPELEEAAGDAVLLALPLYADEKAPGSSETHRIARGLRYDKSRGVPHVMMLDAEGNLYTVLIGNDDLGDGELGLRNIAERLARLRQRNELLKAAESCTGLERAKLLGQVADMGVIRPAGLYGQMPDTGIIPLPNILKEIKRCDPNDSLGLLRRHGHNHMSFLQEQYPMNGGNFRVKDFEPELDELRKACNEVIQDEGLRQADRQAAFGMLVAEMRRQFEPAAKIKAFLRQGIKIDEKARYGTLLTALIEAWGNSARVSPEERRAARERKKKRLADKKKKMLYDRRAERDVDFNESEEDKRSKRK